LLLSVIMIINGRSITAKAMMNEATVVSTKKITKRTYHGKKGNIYSSAKLTNLRYKMKKHTHTTWTATKQAVVKRNGKQAVLSYIKAGSKKGWIYSKYLITGKAPTKKATRATKILSTNNPKKYVAAYNRFSGKGHPLTERGERGYMPEDDKFLKKTGFSYKMYKFYVN